jgi:glycosidase
MRFVEVIGRRIIGSSGIKLKIAYDNELFSLRGRMSRPWPTDPCIYEINTWVWLEQLSARVGRRIDLASVPPEVWDEFAAPRFDAIWLMGVWQRSAEGRKVALGLPGLLDECDRITPDFTEADLPGSPYSISNYVVDAHLGGPEGLAAARQEIQKRGLRLVLDFVPNHVGLDHPLVRLHPEYFIRGGTEDLNLPEKTFFKTDGDIIAHGKDPYFPPWTDTAQVNAFNKGLGVAAIETLLDIAAQCDGVRCDMAMLVINEIFAATWRAYAGEQPAKEYWADVITEVKKANPDFFFIAEAYWDREGQLQQLGFDYCYDKRLYDRLVDGTAHDIREHLSAGVTYQEKLLRFLENHDEPRAAAVFPPLRYRAATLVLATVPGAKLYYQGQLTGARVKWPVQLGRVPVEPEDAAIKAWYERLFQLKGDLKLNESDWQLCDVSGWPGNESWNNLLAWSWTGQSTRSLTVINFSDVPAQGRVHLPWHDQAGADRVLADQVSGERYIRNGDELATEGLYVRLGAWQFHVLVRES